MNMKYLHVIIFLLQCGIFEATMTRSQSRKASQRSKKSVLRSFMKKTSRMNEDVFILGEKEIDYFRKIYKNIHCINQKELNILIDIKNIIGSSLYQEQFISLLKNHLEIIIQQRIKSESLTISSFEYFKIIEFLYQTILYIVQKRKNQLVDFVLVIENKIVPFLIQIHNELTQHNHIYDDELLLIEKSQKYDNSKQCKLLLNFINEYLAAQGLNTISNEKNLHIDTILHFCSNFIVQCRMENILDPEVCMNVITESKNKISERFQDLLKIDVNLMISVCEIYKQLYQYLNLRIPGLERTMIHQKLIISPFNLLNQYIRDFGSKKILCLSLGCQLSFEYAAVAA